MVPHSLLIDKLKQYEFRGASLNWIISNLSGRMQTVFIEGTCSALLLLQYGVPQGSFLGPSLYIIFTNHFFEVVHERNDLLNEGPAGQDHLTVQQHTYSMLCPDCEVICLLLFSLFSCCSICPPWCMMGPLLYCRSGQFLVWFIFECGTAQLSLSLFFYSRYCHWRGWSRQYFAFVELINLDLNDDDIFDQSEAKD